MWGIFSFLGAIVASALGTALFLRWRRVTTTRRPLRKILNLGTDEVRFVFVHRETPSFVLPRTSTEDFMAINNAIGALTEAENDEPIKFYDPERLSAADRQRNLFSFCSPKSNSITAEIERELLGRRLPIYRFVECKSGLPDEWEIEDSIGGRFPSRSFREINEYRKQGVPDDRLQEKRFHDIAVITKASNPWNALNKVFIVAGLRGIGTWGAAECLKKEWRQIYERLDRDKRADFSALIAVTYENCDITEITVENVKIL